MTTTKVVATTTTMTTSSMKTASTIASVMTSSTKGAFAPDDAVDDDDADDECIRRTAAAVGNYNDGRGGGYVGGVDGTTSDEQREEEKEHHLLLLVGRRREGQGRSPGTSPSSSSSLFPSLEEEETARFSAAVPFFDSGRWCDDDIDDHVHRYRHHCFYCHNDFGGYYCGDDDCSTYWRSCLLTRQGLGLGLLRGGDGDGVDSGSDRDSSFDGQQQQQEGHSKRGDSNIGATVSAGETTTPPTDDATTATTTNAAFGSTTENTSVDLPSASAAAAATSSTLPPQQDLQQPFSKTPSSSSSQQLQVTQSPPRPLQQQRQQQHRPPTTKRSSSDSSSSSSRRRRRYLQQQQQQYSFLATRVVGGSALVDKQTGRVFWEDSGSSSGSASSSSTTTLWENLAQKRGLDKIENLSSVILTTILSLVVLNLVFQTIRQSNFMISLLEKLKSVPSTTSSGGTSLKSIKSIISYAVLKFLVGLFLLVGWVLQNIPLVSSVVIMTPRQIVDTLHQHQDPHDIQLTSRPSFLLFIIIGLYLLEAYTCQTRQYLSNTFCTNGEEELQSYIEQLKDSQPVVTWTVTKFHYETRQFIKVPIQVVQNIVGSIKQAWQTLSQPRPVNTGMTTADGGVSTTNDVSDSSETSGSSSSTTDDNTSNQQYSPPVLYPFLTKRVVSRKATANYDFGACHDYSTIGVWEFPRDNQSTKSNTNSENGNGNDELHTTASSNSSRGHPAWTKFVLTKLLVLSNERARKDYFQQQSDFVDRATNQGGPKGSSSANNNSNDSDYIQFSTRIDIPGYRPRVLLVENHKRPRQSTDEQSATDETSRQMIDDILSQQQQQQQDPKDYSIAPYRAGLVQFWIWTLFGMTLPYRVWFKRHCEVVRVSLIKETMMQSNSSIFSSRNKIQDQQGYWGSSYYQSWKNWFTGERSTGGN